MNSPLCNVLKYTVSNNNNNRAKDEIKISGNTQTGIQIWLEKKLPPNLAWNIFPAEP